MTRNPIGRSCVYIRNFFAFVLFAGMFVVAQNAYAARTITGATLNGAASVAVDPGATLAASVTVLLTAGSAWQCTSWRIGTSGVFTSVNHGNHSATYWGSETFNITAPATPGTYDVYFRAYSNNGCSQGEVTYTMTDAVTVALPAPKVVSINRVSTNPTSAGVVVSWTVTFDRSVTGVNDADFVLVQAGGLSGASITQVTGSGTTWTVSANTGTGSGTLGLHLIDDDSIRAGTQPLGGSGLGNGNFTTGQVYNVAPPFCSQPDNTPDGLELTCVCDTFGRTSLNPSTIFGANWIVSTSDTTGILPSIVNGYLRLTNNTGNNAKAATVPGIFPAKGNYISVEFQHFAYGGGTRGADGIAVTLSDYSVPAVPGAFGGSLGYAQKTSPSNIPGFQGGWIGVALDEYGNFQNPTEGRIGGPGEIRQSVGVRGSGSGLSGYRWLAGTAASLNGAGNVDNSTSSSRSPGHYYQVIVDARNDPTSTSVIVNRNTGSGYAQLISIPNVYTAAAAQSFTQGPVPENWQISFTGSTGGSTNFHEIGGLRICAQTAVPPSGGTASGFNAIDEAYGATPLAVQNYLNGHIYMKLVGTPFKLNVAALNNNQIQTTYAAGSNKLVTVKLVDNSDGGCVLDSSKANYCSSTCKAKPAVDGGSQTLTFTSTDKGQKQSGNFTINTAYRNLVAIISDDTTTACSTDAFSVRPLSIDSVTSADATNTGISGTPFFKAGSGKFSLQAVTSGIATKPGGYTGVMKIENTAVQAVSPAAVAGAVDGTFAAAVSGTGSSTATGTQFSYSEVGAFRFLGFDPATNGTSVRGVYDGVHSGTDCKNMTTAQCDALRVASWTGVDSVSTWGDCIADNYSNTKSASGKYGCNFGIKANTASFGRFIPDRFVVSEDAGEEAQIINRSRAACMPESDFTYMGEPMRVSFTLKSLNATGGVTRNYVGSHAKLSTTSWLNYGTANSIGVWMNDAREDPTGTCSAFFSRQTPSSTTFNCSGVATPAAIARAAGPRVTVVPGTATTPAWINGKSAFSAELVLERADKPDGPYTNLNFGIAPQDEDGVTLATFDMDADNSGSNERLIVGTTNARYGRLLIPNLYGSELTAMNLNVEAQYWNGSGYRRNAEDSCTPLTAANFTLSQGPGAVIATSVTGGGLANDGVSVVGLGKPTNAPTKKGSVMLESSATAPAAWALNRYLPGTGMQTFGISRGAVIYLREIY